MKSIKIGLVGPCTAGKSTIKERLTEMGYHVRHIAQEHSYVPMMWKKLANPDVLIFLDVSYQTSLTRKRMDWTEGEYREQQHRLRMAREHANLYIPTDQYLVEDVVNLILEFIGGQESSPD